MEELAADPTVTDRLPFVREALLAGASTQLRNMATIGGNILQRTRCRYFRDPTVAACNKRAPGSGCAAVTGAARMHAILGASKHCIALHASDLCVALVALDAVVHILGRRWRAQRPADRVLRPPGRPARHRERPRARRADHARRRPAASRGARSGYLKVRDRASYEFALTSAAAALVIEDGTIATARVAVGGVATIPWRAREAEAILTGATASADTFRSAAEAAIQDPFTVPGTAFKVELAKRTIVRILQTISGIQP